MVGGVIADEMDSWHPIAVGQHIQYDKHGNVKTGIVKSEYTCLRDGLPVVNVACNDGTSMMFVSDLILDLNYDPNVNNGIINFNYNQTDHGGNSIPVWKSAGRNKRILLATDEPCDIYLITKGFKYQKARFIETIDGTSKCIIKLDGKQFQVEIEKLSIGNRLGESNVVFVFFCFTN